MNSIDVRVTKMPGACPAKTGCVEYVNGAPLANDREEAPGGGATGNGASGAYRPRYEAVAEQILQLIGDLALRPGDRMPTEKELATRLATSRTVVRDAVKILSATGRVSAQKGRGLYVADGASMLGATRWGGLFVPTNLDHIFMLFEFRRVQEMQASRLAARRASPSSCEKSRPRCRPAAAVTPAATTRSSSGAMTPSTSASPPPRTMSSSCRPFAKPGRFSARPASSVCTD